MNIRHFASVCSATALLGLGLVACASDASDETSEATGAAVAAPKKAIPAPPINPCTYAKCAVGYTCDPNVGGCVANPPVDPCTYIKCAAGYTCDSKVGACVANQPTICQLAKCANGYHCEEPTGCVPNTFDCSTVRCAAGTQNVPTLGCCLPQCGGIRGLACGKGATCVDVPNDGCDPKNGGADCGGVCVGGSGSGGQISAQ